MKRKDTNLRILLKLTLIATGIVYIINKLIIYNSSKNRLARALNKHYFISDNGNLFFTKRGKGKPIILIHDLTPGGSGYEWRKIENDLSKKHTVYTIDLFGCGRSEKRAMHYTNYFYIEALQEFIKKIIGEKTDILASGYSSSIAIMLNQTNPDLVRKTMLVNPCNLKKYTKRPSRKDKTLQLILQVPVFGTLIYHMLVSYENIENLFIENYYYNPFHLDMDMEEAYYEAAHRENSLSKYVYVSLLGNYTGCNVSRALQKIDKKISIIFGESEPNCKEIIDQYQEANAHVTATIIRHTKHFPHVEKPKTFLNQIDQFFI